MFISFQQRMFAGLLALGCALAADVFSQTTTPAAAREVRVIDTRGTVEVQRAGTAGWSEAAKNQSLAANDRLKTGVRSRAWLRWSEDSQLRVGDLTTVRILPPAKAGALNDAYAERGMFYFFHRGKPGEMRMMNNLVTAAIQGTEFYFEVDPNDGTTRIAMFDGEVELSNALGTERITSGQSAIVQPGQPPRRTAMLQGGGRQQWLGQWRDLIQWCLYYPAVLDVDEAGLAPAEQQLLAESLAAYRQGDLLQAVEKYPAGRQPTSAAEAVYLAALILSVGDVKQAEGLLDNLDDVSLPGRTDTHLALANALRKQIASVKFQSWPSNAPPRLATEWMAESYHRQSLGKIDEAREAALAATKQSPQFGFAWARVAELEFSRGHTDAALKALDEGLRLSPRNAQALALNGFLFAARNRIATAQSWFDQAIAIDPALGNAWLGRGLCRIRRGDDAGGREDLLTAAALEPQRSLLRSYLGKAFASGRDPRRALHELELAKSLDPADPTPWLYSALLNADYSRINEGIRDLERSKELNDNRQVYRSRLRLDEDRGVRRANLAQLYSDAALEDVALQEAGRAVVDDYSSHSAHLFLANSYETLRRAGASGVRYETSAFSEYLLANLIGPADGPTLSGPVSQQEYSRLFDRRSLGLAADTEYLSRGAWRFSGSQFGTLPGLGYAINANYVWDPGQWRNQDQEQRQLEGRLKLDLSPKDGLLVQVFDYRSEGGDTLQRYRERDVAGQFRYEEEQSPSVVVGYQRQWSPEQRTLLLFTRFDDVLDATNGHTSVLALDRDASSDIALAFVDVREHYRSRLELYSFEAQHVMKLASHTLIGGGRLLWSQRDAESLVTDQFGENLPLLGFTSPVSDQDQQQSDFSASLYAYDFFQLTRSLQLIGGLEYVRQELPDNLTSAPLSEGSDEQSRLNPKAGFVWSPSASTSLRGSYTKSLLGDSLGQSVRLEPTHLAGMVQSFRDPMPVSLVGHSDGAEVQSAEALWEGRFGPNYLSVGWQWLAAERTRDSGLYVSGPGPVDPATPGSIRQRLSYDEHALEVAAHRLIGEEWSVGVRYRAAYAEQTARYPDYEIPFADGDVPERWTGWLHTVSMHGLYRHSCGWFAGSEATWRTQEVHEDDRRLPGDSAWQVALYTGYRFARRKAEVTIGLLNVTGEDYQFHPINAYPDLPRSRTFFARFRFNF